MGFETDETNGTCVGGGYPHVQAPRSVWRRWCGFGAGQYTPCPASHTISRRPSLGVRYGRRSTPGTF